MKKHSLEIRITAILVIISVLLVVGIGGFFLLQSRNEENRQFMAFYDNILWEIKENEIIDIDDSQERKKILNDKIFSIYSQNVFTSESRLYSYNNDWYSSSNNGLLLVKYPMIAYSGPGEVDVIDIKIEELDEQDFVILNQYTKEKNYSISKETPISFASKVAYDFDNDDEIETLYIATNLYKSYEEITEDTMSFQIVLYYDGDNSQVIRNDYVSKNDERTGDIAAYQIISIIKLPNQEKYGIVINKYRSMGELNVCPTLYLYQNDHYEQVKTCKEMES